MAFASCPVADVAGRRPAGAVPERSVAGAPDDRMMVHRSPFSGSSAFQVLPDKGPGHEPLFLDVRLKWGQLHISHAPLNIDEIGKTESTFDEIHSISLTSNETLSFQCQTSERFVRRGIVANHTNNQ